MLCLFQGDSDHLDLPVLTHAFPTRRSSDLVVEPSMTSRVILDFWAEWCGPCKQLGPVLEKVAADYADKEVALVKVDVDANRFIAGQFQVQSIDRKSTRLNSSH